MVKNSDKSNQKVHVLTKEGYKELEEELRLLAQEKLPKVIERVANAREQGDLNENADYQAARDEQNFLEGKIVELQEILAKARVVDVHGRKSSVVELGSTVHVRVKGGKMRLRIVGPREADPARQKISHESPIGQALLGKKSGDEVTVEAPIGKVIYKIVKIE